MSLKDVRMKLGDTPLRTAGSALCRHHSLSPHSVDVSGHDHLIFHWPGQRGLINSFYRWRIWATGKEGAFTGVEMGHLKMAGLSFSWWALIDLSSFNPGIPSPFGLPDPLQENKSKVLASLELFKQTTFFKQTNKKILLGFLGFARSPLAVC